MCRLFGFRSVTQSQIHRSLIVADNALAVQSRKHNDGWGVAYYIANAPHVVKSVKPAIEDAIFERVGGVVQSQTVLAHLRLATTGVKNVLNSHPFQHGQWTFAHNGQINHYDEVEAPLKARISPALSRFILGTTDSEALFYLFLSHLAQTTEIHQPDVPIPRIAEALAKTLQVVHALAVRDEPSKMSVIVTNGGNLVALRRVTPLNYSTFKKSCQDQATCPFYDQSCLAPTNSGRVTHLLVSSEPLQGLNEWTAMQDHEIVGVDREMRLTHGRLFVDGTFALEKPSR